MPSYLTINLPGAFSSGKDACTAVEQMCAWMWNRCDTMAPKDSAASTAMALGEVLTTHQSPASLTSHSQKSSLKITMTLTMSEMLQGFDFFVKEVCDVSLWHLTHVHMLSTCSEERLEQWKLPIWEWDWQVWSKKNWKGLGHARGTHLCHRACVCCFLVFWKPRGDGLLCEIGSHSSFYLIHYMDVL